MKAWQHSKTLPLRIIITATKDGYAPPSGWGSSLGEPYEIQLDSMESLKQRDQHDILAVVAPPFLVIFQDGSASAIATVHSFGRPSRASVILQERFDPSLIFLLEAHPR